MAGSIDRDSKGRFLQPPSDASKHVPKHVSEQQESAVHSDKSQKPFKKAAQPCPTLNRLPAAISPASKSQSPVLMDEADLLLSETRTLLNQTPDHRHVSLPDTDAGEPPASQSTETQPHKTISERTICTEDPQPSRGWLSILSPSSWFSTKSTADRTVTSNEPGFLDRNVIFVLISTFLSRYITGLSGKDMSCTLKQLSTVYHKSCRGQPFEPEVIHLDSMELPQYGVPLKDVKLTLHEVHPTAKGEGSDPFKQLRIKVSIAGKAAIKLDDDTIQDTELTMPETELTLNFKDGHIIKRLLESGGIYGNLGALFTNRHNLTDSLSPSAIQCHIQNATLSTQLTGTPDTGQTALTLNNVNLSIDRLSGTEKKAGENAGEKAEKSDDESYNMHVTHLDARIHSHKLQPIIPKSLRCTLEKTLPRTLFGTTDIHLKTERMDIHSTNGKKSLHCPTLNLTSKGDIGFDKGEIKGLTIASQSNQKPDGASSKTAIGFRRMTGDLNIPQSTFQQPYDLKGPLTLGKGVVYLKSASPENDDSHAHVAFSTEEADITLEGGIEFDGTAKTITGHIDIDQQITDIKISETKAKHFAVGTDPDQVTDENRYIRGSGSAKDIDIHVAPDPTSDGEIQTNLSIKQMSAQNLHGIIDSQGATLSHAWLRYVPVKSETAIAKNPNAQSVLVETGAEETKLTHTDISEWIPSEGLEANLGTTTLTNARVAYRMDYTPTSKVEQNNYGKTFQRTAEEWQRPPDKIVYTDAAYEADTVNTSMTVTTAENAKVSGTLTLTKPAFTTGQSTAMERMKVSLPAAKFDVKQMVGGDNLEPDYAQINDKLQTLTKDLPEKPKKQLQLILSNLKTLQQQKQEQLTHQDAVKPQGQNAIVNASHTVYEVKVDQQDTYTTDVSVEELDVALPSGQIKGEGKVKNIKSQIIQESAGKSKTNITADSVNVQTKLDLTGTDQQPLQPLHVEASMEQLHMGSQHDASQKLNAITIGEIKLSTKNTEDQLGLDLTLEACATNASVATRQAPEERDRQITAKLDSGKLNIKGSINGTAGCGKVGATLDFQSDKVKINSHSDAQSLTADFPNFAQEIAGTLKKKNNTHASPLEKSVNLDTHQQLDKTLTGHISFSMKGALYPFVSQAIKRSNSRFIAKYAGVIRLLTFALNFCIKLDKLPVTNGKIKAADLTQYLSISFFSRHAAMIPFASLCESIVNTMQGSIIEKIMENMNMIDENTGEIHLAKILKITEKDVNFVTNEELPEVRLPDAFESPDA